MTVFWSRAHRRHRHVTTCQMKFAVRERNVASRYNFAFWLYLDIPLAFNADGGVALGRSL